MMRLCFLNLLIFSQYSFAADSPPVDYSRDIRPVLANSCYACHGPDEKQRKGELRLDVRAEAIKRAIKPGKASESKLIKRVASKAADEVMPPPDSKKHAITPEQAVLLQRWIDQGAKFDQHWAYVKPVVPAIPVLNKYKDWQANPIDAFVAAGLERHGLTSAGPATKVTLIRRLSFDLTGLPPTPEEVDAFVADNSPNAFEKVVDRLLASKHFGERMAVYWLDVVRYSDTAGYHSDNHRDVTMFRDFVINSFNANKPFDQFTIEQIAGDLIPNATTEQKIASGYNRMLQTTEEGGAQAKEYTAKYAADRVRNASSAWMAATMGCCECHNHKYDPYATKDFYSFAAFFADVQEQAVGRQPQTPIAMPEQEAEMKKLDGWIAKLKEEMQKASVELDAAQTKWEASIKKDGKGLPKPVTDALAVEPAKRNPQQKQTIRDHFRMQVAPELAATRKELASTQAKRDQLGKSIPQTLITTSMPNPRTMRILPRGNWLDDSGEIVSPNIPAFLGTLDVKNRRANRMDLAHWLVSPENPLTARVFVNRLWKITFGHGLVRNMEDFGMQGTLPSHPELLDYLANEFIASKWNIKAMLKRIVMTRTYQQSSFADKSLAERDPTNHWLARQDRFRLDAEFVRDNALSVSGLLVPKVGGGSVRPYQPVGYWAYLNFPTREWASDKGENQYRRGLYTYWCRSFLHPSLAAFDAPSREECTNERPRSSTPLQALVLLNDPTYVEAAHALAEKTLREVKGDAKAKLDYAYRRALSRPADAKESAILLGVLEKHKAEYAADKAAAQKMLTVGDRPMPKDLDAAELAAWTSVTRIILNLHETITRN
jgi:hypothetical protein